MQIRFWGTRGTIAKPGPTTLRYGGNTSCVEVRADDGTLIVLDCGTGSHALGQALVASGVKPLRGHLFISHTHWDHIQGFPLFAPLFIPGNEWDIYAPGGLGQRLDQTLAGQMEHTYFPLTIKQLGATIRFHDLGEQPVQVGSVTVTPRYLNHPALTLGYRLESGGVSLVYAVDHEPHGRPPSPDVASAEANQQMLSPVHREDQEHVAFLADADLVIHDAQYTLAEYPAKVGWGHTPIEQAVAFAVAAGAARLALFHHDPLRTDDQLVKLERQAVELALQAGSPLHVFAASEGRVLELPERVDLTAEREAFTVHGWCTLRCTPAVADAAVHQSNASLDDLDSEAAAAASRTVLIVDDQRDVVRALVDVLEVDGFQLLEAYDGETALQMAREHHPALILMDWMMPGMDGLTVCRALRADPDPQVSQVPVVLLTARASHNDTADGFESGVTDYLTKPFNVAYVQSRVREWLLRSGAAPAPDLNVGTRQDQPRPQGVA